MATIDYALRNDVDPTLIGDSGMDIYFDATGKIATVTGIEKLNLQIQKCILTTRSTENLYPKYGGDATIFIGQKHDPVLIVSYLTQAIIEAIQYLVDIQTSQQAINDFDADELIHSIQSIDINPLVGYEKTGFEVMIQVNTKAGNENTTYVQVAS